MFRHNHITDERQAAVDTNSADRIQDITTEQIAGQKRQPPVSTEGDESGAAIVVKVL
jgi:hypothetical protein